MQITRLIIFLCGFFLTLGCTNNTGPVTNHKDSVQKKEPEPEDTTGTDYESCYEGFFKGLPRFSDSGSAMLLLKNGKTKSITQFFKDEFMSPVSEYGLKDLDKDSVMDLIIFNYTGGPHCCDEYFIFRQKSERLFEVKAHIMGQACIDSATDNISYSFNEAFGYFFTCYSCEFADSSGPFQSIREIDLRYTNSKLKVMPYDSISEKQNITNLEVLQKHGFEKMQEMMDNGWRKEFAMNLAIWYYNHNKNWKQTKKLFQKYYNFHDAARVWNEFHRTMIESQKENSF